MGAQLKQALHSRYRAKDMKQQPNCVFRKMVRMRSVYRLFRSYRCRSLRNQKRSRYRLHNKCGNSESETAANHEEVITAAADAQAYFLKLVETMIEGFNLCLIS